MKHLHVLALCLALLEIPSVQASLMCPSQCSTARPEDCMTNPTICPANSFCEIHQTAKGEYQGVCERTIYLHTCQQHVHTSRCSTRDMQTVHGYHVRFCKIACCDNQDCVAHSGFTKASPVPTTHTSTTTRTTNTTPMPTTVTTTTQAPTTTLQDLATTTTTAITTQAPTPTSKPTPNYSQYLDICQDLMEPGLCSSLKETDDVCHTKLQLCPETCGVCEVAREFDCHDTILNNGCENQFVPSGICTESMGKYACPASCGLCDVMLAARVQQHLDTLTGGSGVNIGK